MILQALTRYYEDLVKQGEIARPGWSRTKISFALCLDQAGNLEQIIPLLEETRGKKPQPRSFDLPTPVKRTVGIAPNFLWDNSCYILGVDSKGKPERAKNCFEACKDLHLQLLRSVNTPVADGIRQFFEKWDVENAARHPALDPFLKDLFAGGNVTFRVNGVFAHEDEAIRDAWQKHYEQNEGRLQQCLVTGELDVIPQIHPAIKGVDGAQSSGAAIVSFNAPAFCSYGHEQNSNAPIGNRAAFAYTSALNYLLSNRDTKEKIGDTTVVCWAEGAERQYQELSFAALFGRETPRFTESDVRNAVKRLADGKPIPEKQLDPNCRFYVLGLAPNAARLSIRFFYRDTFGKLMQNVNSHYERLQIQKPAFDKYETLPLWALLRETVNPKSRDKSASPVLAGSVARAVFNGERYPAALLEQVMLRVRAERDINRGKAAIIKAYYSRNSDPDCPKEVLTVGLNEASTNPAYTLGRLFSVYEAVQEAANPGINATIKDKFFNAASSTPATIFPVLNNLCQKHLRKLGTGKRVWYEKQIMTLVGILGEEFPSRLSLAQQGSFDLGYYHQTQKRYEKKEEK